MHPKLDQLLGTRYPKIFEMTSTTRHRSSLPCGFECADGWFDLCGKIQAHVDSTGADQVIASQVTEKYGELRFYYVGADDIVDKMIDDAETLSGKTCEYCGAPGRIVESKRGWLRTRCTSHIGDHPALGASLDH